MTMNILAVGDVVSPRGLAYLRRKLRQIKTEYAVDFTVVNGENASMTGLTPDQAEEMLDAGADVITLGNHTWNRRAIVPYLDDCAYILRPANFPPQLPGRGLAVYDTNKGPVALSNFIGRCDMKFGSDNPFLMAENWVKTLDTKVVLMDFHAEATSEKLAMAYLMDGKCSAIWGTHTHVPTADTQILPNGTGYVTDLGMTGPAISVLGVKPEQSIATFRGDLTSRFEAAEGPCKLNAALFTIDTATGHCTHLQRIDLQG